jgi:protein-S-isoprenylcysteine O-methyltransferase Ste14
MNTKLMNAKFWKTLASSLGYVCLAFLCLIRWGTPHPWARVDFFSGGYLALKILNVLHSVWSSRSVFRSQSVMREWWALDSDPKGPQWIALLMLADLTIFLEYGHWLLVPKLQQPVLQSIGLMLYLTTSIWQIWTDVYLARYFNRKSSQMPPMARGPYRYVRHPRYSAAIIAKGALALTLASVFGWLLAVVWLVILVHKITVEELHLKSVFGSQYDAYSQTTARVIPGIY